MNISRNRNVSFNKTTFITSNFVGWRSKVTVLLIGFGFLGLIIRAFWVQVANKDFYAEQGNKRVQRTVEVVAARGSIFDCRGRILAMNQRVAAIFADPTETNGKLSRDATKKLSRLLKIQHESLLAKLKRDSSFVYLAKQQSYELGERIAAMHLPGIYRMPEWQRVYPLGECMSHVVGFSGSDGMGQEGVELSMNAHLVSKNGQRMILRDRMGRVVEDLGLLMTPTPGQNVNLTIDSRLQHLVFSRLKEAVLHHKAKAASAVIVHAKTGEILALANWPAYDPGNPMSRKGDALRNRAVTDLFEPGSTIKPLNIALALDRGHVSPSTLIDTSGGKLALGGGYTVSDVSINHRLSVENVVKKSSNVGMVRIMSKISAEQMWGSFRRFGIGQAPHLTFPGVASGWLRPPRFWKPIEQATMSYGYGLSVSLLQMAEAYTVFTCNGNRILVSLLKDQKKSLVPVISEATAKKMRHILELSASPRSYVNGYRIAGKSGTTRKLVSGNYRGNHFLSQYIGFLPASDPEIIIAVMVDDPLQGGYYGGVVAAPIFAEIAKGAMHLLEVKPDMLIGKVRFLSGNDETKEPVTAFGDD